MDITPRDQTESKTIGAGKAIIASLAVVIAAASTLLATIGNLQWVIDNLPLLGTGLASLVTGGFASYVAVRRMGKDKNAAKDAAAKAGLLLIALLPLLSLTGCICRKAWLRTVMILLLPAFLLSGCTGVYTPKLSAISFGIDSAQALAGLNVNYNSSATNNSYEIILDSSSGSQSSSKLIDGLIAVGEIAARAKGIPAASTGVESPASEVVPSAVETDAAPATTEAAAETDYSADGYGGSPGAAGEGVYGRPSCARCRAYRAAHPDAQLINIDTPANRADMWAALRLRGFVGTSAALPVVVTATAYTVSAR